MYVCLCVCMILIFFGAGEGVSFEGRFVCGNEMDFTYVGFCYREGGRWISR